MSLNESFNDVKKRKMKLNTFSEIVMGSSALLLMYAHGNEAMAADTNPNIILILVDDMGYGDLNCYGGTGYMTPNFNRLASQGMMFTSFYSGSSVSTPSRAALLTGCYPPRVGLTDVLLPGARIGLNHTETTIPELLKEAGYVTGIIGKWHLGDHKSMMPMEHGFDEFYGLPYSNDLWPVHYNGRPVTRDNYLKEWKLNCPPLFLFEGGEAVKEIKTLEDQDQLTTLYTGKAQDFIKQNRGRPFFLYFAHSMPHVPLGVSEKFKGMSEAGLYGDVIMELDWSVGEIMKTLSESGIEKNTLIIFTSDNGPWINYGNHAGSAGGLREAKNSVFEGGYRVPCIMVWPEVIQPGGICNRMCSSIDIMPTLAEITETGLPDSQIDGVSLLSLLQGNFNERPRREYYFYIDRALNAVRYDNWKLVFPHVHSSNEGSIFGKDGWPGIFNVVHFPGGLYDLNRDPGERYDLKIIYPLIVSMLEEKADSLRRILGDSLEEMAGKDCRQPGRISN